MVPHTPPSILRQNVKMCTRLIPEMDSRHHRGTYGLVRGDLFIQCTPFSSTPYLPRGQHGLTYPIQGVPPTVARVHLCYKASANFLCLARVGAWGVSSIFLRQSHVLLRNQKIVQNSFILDSYAYLFNAKNKFKILRGRGPAVLIRLFRRIPQF